MTAGRSILALVFIVAGILHFFLTATYVKIMPPYLPAHTLLVQLSGVFEILGGIGILVPMTQRFSAWGLIALLIAVSPANIQMAMDHAQWPGIPVWVLWLRVPMQLPLMWWAWLYTRR
jgi:uncharacterized membrane protein